MGGSSITIDFAPNCKGPHRFYVILTLAHRKALEELKVSDEIFIKFNNETIPKLEVRRISDDLEIGLVPPSKIVLLNCIKDGWEYRGIIQEITGNRYDAKVVVEVNGD